VIASFSCASEGLVEVGRVGDTSSALVYYDAIVNKVAESATTEKILEQSSELLQKQRLTGAAAVIYPLTTEYTPGHFERILFDKPISIIKPFAVVGTDELSVEWLLQRKNDLARLNAPVYVVSANSSSEVENLITQFPELTFAPVNGSSIFAQVKATHFPFLVNRTGVWQ
jgi:integrating conjugative element protein (TIGR03765 family)